MKYNYLYIYLFVLIVCLGRVQSDSDCESLASGSVHPFGELQDEEISTYWNVEMSYNDNNSGLLVEFGGLGRTTGAKPQTYYRTDYYMLKFFENDVYDLYFTYRLPDNSLCNYTREASDITQRIVKVTFEPLKCLYSELLVTVTNNSVINAQSYSMGILSNPSMSDMPITSSTFQFPSMFQGDFLLKSPAFQNNIQIPFKVSPQNNMIPIVESVPIAMGETPKITIRNYKDFLNISLVAGLSMDPVAPISAGLYPYNPSDYNILIANSTTCGTQTMMFSQMNLIAGFPSVVSTIESFDVCLNNFNVSFINPGTDINTYNLSISNQNYIPNTDYQTIFDNSVRLNVQGAEIKYKTPKAAINVTYSILKEPTCENTGTAKIHYNGDSSNIMLNGNSFSSGADMEFTITKDNTYTIGVQCFDESLTFSTYYYPTYTQTISEQSCMGLITIVSQNYQDFNTLYIYDTHTQTYYNHTNGVFTGMLVTNQLFLNYESCGKMLSMEISSYELGNPSMDEYSFEYEFEKPQSCENTVNVTMNISYKNKLISTIYVDKYLGQTQTFVLDYGICDFYLQYTVPNDIDTVSYKIITPADCIGTLGVAQIVSTDESEIVTISEDDNLIPHDSNFVFSATAGEHIIKVLLQNERGYNCKKVFNMTIPHVHDIKLEINTVRQDSNNCSANTGKLLVVNPQDYLSLSLHGTPISNLTGEMVIGSGVYPISYSHKVCGTGTLNVKVETDGQIGLNEIKRPSCPYSKGTTEGSGIYEPYVVATNGNIYKNLDMTETGQLAYIQSLGIFPTVPDGTFNLEASNGSCKWELKQEFQSSGLKFEFTDIKGFDFIRNIPGYAKIGSNQPVGNLEYVLPDSGTYYYPDEILSIYINTGADFVTTISYDNACSVEIVGYVDESSPRVEDYYKMYRYNCSSLDIYLQFDSEFLKNFTVYNQFGGSTDNEGRIKTYLDSFILVRSKDKSYTNVFPIMNSPSVIPVAEIEAEVKVIDETCTNSGDGSITITNYNSDNIYALNRFDSILPVNVSSPSTWTGLYNGVYTLLVLGNGGQTCSTKQILNIGSSSASVNPIQIVNQCSANSNGSVTFQGLVGSKPTTSFEVIINGITYAHNEIINLPSGIYQYLSIVSDSKCRQSIQGQFEISSNFFTSQVESSQCGVASIKVSNFNSSHSLAITLYNNNGNTPIGVPTIGSSAKYTDLKNGTYYFIVKDDTGCQVSSDKINIIECETPTPTPTSTTGINQSNQISTPSFLIILVLFISYILF